MVKVPGSLGAVGFGAALVDGAEPAADAVGFEGLAGACAAAAGALAHPASTAAASPRASGSGVRMMRRV
jgi:hypothetical protein